MNELSELVIKMRLDTSEFERKVAELKQLLQTTQPSIEVKRRDMRAKAFNAAIQNSDKNDWNQPEKVMLYTFLFEDLLKTNDDGYPSYSMKEVWQRYIARYNFLPKEVRP